jgi:hypothetical protein
MMLVFTYFLTLLGFMILFMQDLSCHYAAGVRVKPGMFDALL